MADAPERWRRLEEICEAALERPAHEREAFLAEVCGTDDDLRLRLVLAGVTLGAGAALALSGAVQGLLYGVAATDLMTIVTIGVTVLAVGFAAALPPAWRATRIDPVAVLRRG